MKPRNTVIQEQDSARIHEILTRFLRESSAAEALVIDRAGQLLAMEGPSQALDAVSISALAAAAWLRGNRPLIDDLAAALITAMFLAGPIFVVLLYVSAHSYVAIPARYGLSLVPGAVAVAALVASRRAVGAWALAGLGAVGCLTMLATLT